MTPEQLEQLALAAREFTVGCGEREYRLRMPTAHHVAMVYRLHRRANEAALSAWLAVERTLLEGEPSLRIPPALIGWSGLREGDLCGDAQRYPDPLVWHERVVPLVLDAFPEDQQRMGDALFARLSERAAQIEELRKN